MKWELLLLVVILGCSPKIVTRQVQNQEFKFTKIKFSSNECIESELPWLDTILNNGMYIAKNTSDLIYNRSKISDYRYLEDKDYNSFYKNIKSLNTSKCFQSKKSFIETFKLLNERNFIQYQLDTNTYQHYSMYYINIDDMQNRLNDKNRFTFEIAYNMKNELFYIFYSNPIIYIN